MPFITAAIAAIESFLLYTATAAGISGAALSTFVTVGVAVIRTAVGIIVSVVAQAIAGKPQKPGFSVQGKLQAGGTLPRSFLIGWAATAGSLVYANTWGQDGKTPNAFFTQVIAVSDLPISGLVEVFINGERVTLIIAEPHADYGYPVLQYRKDGQDFCWVKFYDGTQTEADPFLVAKVSSEERPYADTRVGHGIAYVILTSRVHPELWTGFPQAKFSFNGVALYDISQDVTLGGEHDWNNQDTWGGDGDHLVAVQIYNLLRGLSYGGKWFYGLQNISPTQLIGWHWIGQVDKCRLPVDGPEGEEPQYRAGGEITVNAPVRDAIEAFLAAAHGRLGETGGVYKLHVGAPPEASFSFTDADIISTSEQSFDPFPGVEDVANGIAAKYPSPADNWAMKDAPAIYRSDLEAEDGGRQLMAEPSLDLCPYPGQVQRVSKSQLQEGRRFRRHTIVLPPEYLDVDILDGGAFTSTRNGYGDKLFRVDGMLDLPNCDVMLDITEWDPADFEFVFDDDYVPPDETPPVIVRPTPQDIIDWAAEGVILEGDDGNRQAAIHLTWDGDQDDVDFVLFRVRLASTEEVIHTGNTADVAAGSIYITQSILRKTTYQVQGEYSALSGRPFLPSAWLTVTTPDVPIVNVPADLAPRTVDYAALTTLIKGVVDYVRNTGPGSLGYRVQLVWDELQKHAALTVNQESRNFEKIEYYKAGTETQFALVARSIKLLVTDTEALAELLDEVQARLDTGDIAQAFDYLSARVTRTENAETGTAQSGSTSTTIKLASGASAEDGWYLGDKITITSGTGSGQTRRITDYVGSTRVASITPAWDVTPNNTSVYAIGLSGQVEAVSSAVTATNARLNGGGDIAATLSSYESRISRREINEAGLSQGWLSTPVRVRLATIASSVDDYYNGCSIVIMDGSQAGKQFTITDYVGSTRAASLSPAVTGGTPTGFPVYYVEGAITEGLATGLQQVKVESAGTTNSVTQMLQATDKGAKGALVLSTNGVESGYVIEGVVDQTGAVSSRFVLSADKIILGKLSDYARNGNFDAQQRSVDPAAANDLQDWYISSGAAQIDVLGKVAFAASSKPTNSTLILQAGTNVSAVNDFYNGQLIEIPALSYSGTVSDYVGSTRTLTVSPNITGTVTAGMAVTIDGRTGVPSGAPNDYVLRLSRSAAFVIWNRADPSVSGANNYSIDVQAGSVWRLTLRAAYVITGSPISPVVRLKVKDATGAIIDQYAHGTMSAGQAIPAQNGDWAEYRLDFDIRTTGKLFWSIDNGPGTVANNVWYMAQVQITQLNGADVTIPGSLTTELVNGQAITDTLFAEIATGDDDIIGSNAFVDAFGDDGQDYTFYLPYNYEGWIEFEVQFGMDFPGSAGWDAYLVVTGASPPLPSATMTGQSYGASFPQAVSRVYIAIPVIGLGEEMTVNCQLRWKGSSSNVHLVGRHMLGRILKR